MILSKIPTIVAFFAFALFLLPHAYAQSPAVQNTQNTTITRPQSSASPGGNLQTRALAEIERRIEKLTTAKNRVEQSTGLSVEMKQSISAEIQEEINNLTSLQTKIESESNATVVGTLVASIVSSYRNYALFMTKTMILSASERLVLIADKMAMVQERILTIATTSANGQDISEIETLLTDAQENITAGRESAQSAMEKVSSLEPDGYPANRATLQAARADLIAARTSLSQARQSLGDALKAWQAMESGATEESMMEESGSVTTPAETQPQSSTQQGSPAL